MSRLPFKVGDFVQFEAVWIPFHPDRAGTPQFRIQKGLIRDVLLDAAEVFFWHPYAKEYRVELLSFSKISFAEPEQEPEPACATSLQ